MPSLGVTTAALKRQRRAAAAPSPRGQARMREVTNFGGNPGALRMFVHVPADLPKQRPLVVTLHGCTQDAEAYQHGAGWASLADRHGFVLLAPEQSQGNNPGRCFNWFQPEDVVRGHGEVESIRQMIAHAVQEYGVDSSRVYVTGLSAGGAMAAQMLAAYPEVFAGGAIIAGLPAGAAHSMQEAFSAMHQGKVQTAETWGAAVRDASNHPGPWPKISIWQGEADPTVVRANAESLVAQWTNVHGMGATPDADERIGGVRHRTWFGPDRRPAVEAYSIPGMGHGTPIAGGPGAVGSPGQFFIDVGLASSEAIARFWGIDEGVHAAPQAASAAGPVQPPRHDILSVINGALRSAGLLR